MVKVLRAHHRLVFYTAWLLINVIQGGYTELFDDEAYYWIYSLFPAWGYFDHPPIIAMLIKAGYAIFPNELGVRFFVILLNTATIYITGQLIDKKNDLLFYAIAVSIGIAHLGGMIAVPDVPLLFFTATFFWLYRRLLARQNVVNAVLLGINMACMLYSKYHGILIIGFTFLSNLKLFRHYTIYLAGVITTLLYIPHLYWQYRHDWPSVYFHLFERNASHYDINYTFEYLLGQIAIAGPVAGWLLIWAAWRYKPVTDLERALKFTLVGFYVVFLVSTLKGRVEANWTVPAFIPLMVICHQYLKQNERFRKWLYCSVPFTLLIAAGVRFYMMANVPPSPRLSKDEMHGNKMWTSALQLQAGESPIVFLNTYQRASKYWFYTKDTAFSLNTPYYRRNNFNLWPLEDSLIGKPAFLAIPETADYFRNFFRKKKWNYPRTSHVNNYFSFSRVFFNKIKVKKQANGKVEITARVTTPSHYLRYFQQSPYSHTPVYIALYEDGHVKEILHAGITVQQITSECQDISFTLPLVTQNTQPGIYTARLCVGTYLPGYPSVNSSGFRLELKE